MPMSKKYLEKKKQGYKAEIAVLEAKCAGGSGTKADYEALAKLKKRL